MVQRDKMSPNHKGKLIAMPNSNPIMGSNSGCDLFSSVGAILVDTSDRSFPVNSSVAMAIVGSIFLLPRPGGKHGIQATARNMPDSGIDHILAPFNCTLSTE